MDRNVDAALLAADIQKSPPARVAWIETCEQLEGRTYKMVATREGGVDRNYLSGLEFQERKGRHPRGWRG